MSERWTPDSWRTKPVLQIPVIPMPRHWRMSRRSLPRFLRWFLQGKPAT